MLELHNPPNQTLSRLIFFSRVYLWTYQKVFLWKPKENIWLLILFLRLPYAASYHGYLVSFAESRGIGDMGQVHCSQFMLSC